VKKWYVLAGITLLLIAAAVAIVQRNNPLLSNERRSWKQKQIAAIDARLANPEWLTNELRRVSSMDVAEQQEDATWLSDSVIMTRKGEWLAYASICRKEKDHIHDLFVARGSDGRWYYSTYHFCIGMVALRMEEQAEDLAGFAKTYFLREFDGMSDCLQKTWPADSR